MKQHVHRPKRLKIHVYYVWRQYRAAIRRGDHAAAIAWMMLLDRQIEFFRRARALDYRKPARKSIRRNRTPDGARKSPPVNRRAREAAQAGRRPVAKSPPRKARR